MPYLNMASIYKVNKRLNQLEIFRFWLKNLHLNVWFNINPLRKMTIYLLVRNWVITISNNFCGF